MTRKRNKGRKPRPAGSHTGNALPLNLLGIATYQQLLDAMTELLEGSIKSGKAVDKEVAQAIRVEIERRTDPVPLRVRKPTKSDVGTAVRDRVREQMRRWCEFYGYGYDPNSKHWLGLTAGPRPNPIPSGPATPDPKVPVEFDMGIGDFDDKTNLFQLHTDQNAIDVPLRVLARPEASKPRVEYISPRDPREAVNELLGGPTSWIGSPPDQVILHRADSDSHGPVILACGYGSEPFKAAGTIEGPLTITDLTKEAETRFVRLALEQPENPRVVGKAVHQAILGYNLAIRQQVVQGEMLSQIGHAQLWPQLRDAVIFEFPTTAFTTLYEAYHQHFLGEARKVVGDKANDDVLYTEYDQLLQRGADYPLPDKVPFPSCYFAFGTGVPTAFIDPTEIVRPGREQEGTLVATLITETRDVITFIAKHAAGSDPNDPWRAGIAALTARKDGKWRQTETLLPWIIPTLIEYVNDHKTLVEEGQRDFAYRRMFDRQAKKLHFRPPVPPPFYVVYLQDKVIQERIRSTVKTARKIEWQHRWQVRGSWNIRVRRGPLPIDPEVEVDLRKRKYQIFAGIPQMDAQLAVEMQQRGIAPRRRDEWLAVLRYWRQAHIKGPEDKPLVESVRRSTKTWGGCDGDR